MRRQRLVGAVLPVDVDLGAEVLPPVLVGEDFAARFSDRFVRARPLAVPVGVEHRLDAAPSRVLGNGLQQIGGSLPDAAIDHQHTV